MHLNFLTLLCLLLFLLFFYGMCISISASLWVEIDGLARVDFQYPWILKYFWVLNWNRPYLEYLCHWKFNTLKTRVPPCHSVFLPFFFSFFSLPYFLSSFLSPPLSFYFFLSSFLYFSLVPSSLLYSVIFFLLFLFLISFLKSWMCQYDSVLFKELMETLIFGTAWMFLKGIALKVIHRRTNKIWLHLYELPNSLLL